MLIEGGFVATNPDRELARARTRRATAHRCVEEMVALLGKLGGEFAHHARGIGRQVENGRALLEPTKQTGVGCGGDGLDFLRTGEGQENNVANLGELTRTVRPCGPIGDERLGGLAPDVMDDEAMVRAFEIPRQVGRHKRAHSA